MKLIFGFRCQDLVDKLSILQMVNQALQNLQMIFSFTKRQNKDEPWVDQVFGRPSQSMEFHLGCVQDAHDGVFEDMGPISVRNSCRWLKWKWSARG